MVEMAALYLFANISPIALGQIFLLVDLREFFFQIKGRGQGKKREKSSENDQLTGQFQSFFFRAFFLNNLRTNS